MRDRRLYEKILGLPEPWRVQHVQLREGSGEILIQIQLRRPRQLLCPECGESMPGYDHRRRRWRHLDTCQYKTIIQADVPRGNCSTHGVRQITVPWAEDLSRFTALLEALAIDWLQEASQIAVGRRLRLTWDQVHGIMHRAVRRGLHRRGEQVFVYIGVDETAFQKRHEYVTVVCDLKRTRVLYVSDGRGSLGGFYEGLSDKQRSGIQAVAMDMWEPYIASTREHLPQGGDKIVFDKFHIVAYLHKAVDEVRRQEHRQLRLQGDERLKGTKYLWLKGRDRFDPSSWMNFRHLRHSELKTARAWAIKQTFAHFWDYIYLGAARRFFEKWYGWAIRSRLEPVKRVARMLKKHVDNILTYLKHRITNAVTEGINSKIQWIKYTARGFANRENFRVAILFHCGRLDLYPL